MTHEPKDGGNPESELLARCRSGNRSAFETLADRNSSSLYRLALGLTGNTADAEDLVQETFLKFMEGLPRFEGRCRISTWLYSILHSLFLTRLRRKKIEEQVNRRHATGHAPSAEPDTALQNALRLSRKLGEALRAPFLLYYVERCPVAEIAAALSLSVPTVKWRLHEARQMLRTNAPTSGDPNEL